MSFLGGLLDSVTGGDVLSAGGSLLSGLIGSSGAKDANAAGAASILQQEKFQKQMSSTAYQRAVKDMEAAGLNPMLAYSQGGASTPTGASMQFQNPNAGLAAGIGGMASSAYNAENTSANIRSTNQSTSNAREQASIIRSGQVTAAEQAKQAVLQTKLTSSAVNAARNASDVASGDFGKVLAYLNAISGAIHGTSSAASAARSAVSP